MKCPECEKQELRSKVFPGASTMTTLSNQPFYDEDGEYHDHDPNATIAYYSCSQGHHWAARQYHTCECGWTWGEPEIKVVSAEVVQSADLVSRLLKLSQL